MTQMDRFVNDWWLPLKDWWHAAWVPSARRAPSLPRVWDDADGGGFASDAQTADYEIAWILNADAVAPVNDFKEGAYSDMDWLHSLRKDFQFAEGSGCAAWEAEHGVNFRSNMLVLLGRALRWGSQERNQELVGRLRSHACISAMESAWLDWYAALLTDDMGGIDVSASHLMDGAEGLTRRERMHLLESRLVALLVLREFQALIDLLKKHQADVYGEGNFPQWLDIPVAMALHQIQHQTQGNGAPRLP